MKYAIVKAIVEVDYLVPMSDDGTVTLLDGRTLDDIRREWFLDYDINRSHATRDAHTLGNGKTCIMNWVEDIQ